QPLYHALNRTADVEQLPACAAYGLGVVVYSPAARGVLTGKYHLDAPPPEGSRGQLQNKRMAETEYQRENLEAAQQVGELAMRRGAEPASFATAGVLAKPHVTAAIAGPRTIAHWRSYRAAAEGAVTAEEEAAVAAS